MIRQDKRLKKYCSEPLERIENYDKAIADKEHVWHCHHRGEILPCGRNPVEKLKRFGLYWNRPASELIFLRSDEHRTLHNIGNKFCLGRKISEETRKRIAERKRGQTFSDEHRKKLSQSQMGSKNHNFGKHFSEETRRKMSEAKRRKS